MGNIEFSQTKQVAVGKEAVESFWENLPQLYKGRSVVREADGYCIDNRFIVTMKSTPLSANQTEVGFFVESKSFRTTPQEHRDTLMGELFELCGNSKSENEATGAEEEVPDVPMLLEDVFHINMDYFLNCMKIIDDEFLTILRKVDVTVRRVKFVRGCIEFESEHYRAFLRYSRRGDEDIFISLEHKQRGAQAALKEVAAINGFFTTILDNTEKNYKEFAEEYLQEKSIPYFYDEEAIEGYNLDVPYHGEKRKLSFFEKLKGAERDACPRCGQPDAMKTLCDILYNEKHKMEKQTVNERVMDKWGAVIGTVEREQYVPTNEKWYWTVTECVFCKYRDSRTRFV